MGCSTTVKATPMVTTKSVIGIEVRVRGLMRRTTGCAGKRPSRDIATMWRDVEATATRAARKNATVSFVQNVYCYTLSRNPGSAGWWPTGLLGEKGCAHRFEIWRGIRSIPNFRLRTTI